MLGAVHSLPKKRVDGGLRPGLAHQRTRDECFLREVLEDRQQHRLVENEISVIRGRWHGRARRPDRVDGLLELLRRRLDDLLRQIRPHGVLLPWQAVIFAHLAFDVHRVHRHAVVLLVALPPLHNVQVGRG